MFQARQFIIPTSSVLLSSIGFIRYDKKQYYTEEEVNDHNTQNDAWITYKNKVYNITNFIDAHPSRKYLNMFVAEPSVVDSHIPRT
jgi:hypothetical protein